MCGSGVLLFLVVGEMYAVAHASCTAANTPLSDRTCSLLTATFQHLGSLVGEVVDLCTAEHLRTNMWFPCCSVHVRAVRESHRTETYVCVAVCASVAQVSCHSCQLHSSKHTHLSGKRRHISLALKTPTSSDASRKEDPESIHVLLAAMGT